jgi:hypothetical protein
MGAQLIEKEKKTPLQEKKSSVDAIVDYPA